MSEEEIYEIITKDVFKYPLLNQIFAIRDNRYKIDNKSICVNGYISLDTIEKVIQLQKENEELKEKVFKRNKELIRLEEYANKNFVRKDDVKAKYIPKDKIRNFIEKHKGNYYDGTANGCDYIDYEVIKEFIEEE